MAKQHPRSNTVARIIHDLSLASWFGGSLMGAIGLNAASREVENPADRTRVANAGWARWMPANLAAIVGYGITGAILMKENKARLVAQKGVKSATVAKNLLSIAALGATAYSRMLGEKMMRANGTSVADAVTPNEKTPAEIAQSQRQLKVLQWVIPAHVGALIAITSRMGEQQRPAQVIRGLRGTLMKRLSKAA